MTRAASMLIESTDVLQDAETVFERVFRTDFIQSGFAVLVLPAGTESHDLRRSMRLLKERLSVLHAERWSEPLEYLSLGRFDQQTTTRLHLDGAPDRSFLMLGYEPTSVRSDFHIADFSRCAHDLGITPADFLQKHNPMFSAGAEMLKDYLTTVSDWQESRSRIVVINNCMAEPGAAGGTHGVLHGATILSPDSGASRVINSTMMAPARFATCDPAMQVQQFVSTHEISGQILS
ncbi:hypothetical protein [Prosthecobacter sp.]|uniref:hypothetical protein n=1 Tax=Prosthecobacter sp. TaxID=1965333 RepID=UPI0037842B70